MKRNLNAFTRARKTLLPTNERNPSKSSLRRPWLKKKKNIFSLFSLICFPICTNERRNFLAFESKRGGCSSARICEWRICARNIQISNQGWNAENRISNFHRVLSFFSNFPESNTHFFDIFLSLCPLNWIPFQFWYYYYFISNTKFLWYQFCPRYYFSFDFLISKNYFFPSNILTNRLI